ncbi:uncharacterized protein LOC108025182 isoform X2 [Drosophila biarmipes]|uniref:uncharacterized protein LOC108025182 isoform X2 n=1 Tax=Drosophila biarmipes TaxID=125945 RepID=UPI0007E6FF04|nr:uncharacterized protein LOC108025182 isoform X2 [Drosophila biarmipes]
MDIFETGAVQRSDLLKRFPYRIGYYYKYSIVYYKATLSTPVDEMQQVTQTVAVAGLLLFACTQSAKLNNQSEESLEIGKIENSIEASMGYMAKRFEEGNGIDGKHSRVILKAFKLGDFIKKKTQHNVTANSKWALFTFS